MRKLYYLPVLFAIIICSTFASCGKTENAKPATTSIDTKHLDAIMPNVVVYNPMVQSFTTGMVGRKEQISITLIEDVPSDIKPEQYLDIEPSVKGEWRISDDNPKILLFRPEVAFEQKMRYNTTMDMKKVFPASSGIDDFAFSFFVMPTEAVAQMSTFTVNENDTFTIEGCLITSDSETPKQVLGMVEWDGINDEVLKNIKWVHNDNGTQHDFVVSGVKAGMMKSEVTLTVEDENTGYQKNEVLSVDVPNSSEFGVHSTEYSDGCIEIRFTKQLDLNQKLNGLVRLEDKSSVIKVADNKVLLYPSTANMTYDKNGLITVVLSISESVRSADNEALGSEIKKEIIIANGDPNVKFPEGGTIMPPASSIAASGNSNAQIIPFQAIGLRAVRVEVYRILENSIGQFIQTNNLGSNDWDVMGTTRPVASQTIFLDKKGGKNLRQWNTYSLELSELIEPEPGALYRITISFNRSMAAMKSIPKEDRLTQKKAQELDEERLNLMIKLFDEAGGYYWNPCEYSHYHDDFNYNERNDPSTMSYYYYNNEPAQRNLLVTDLGVIAKAADEAQMMFLVHSIATTKPVDNATVELRNYQGQIVGQGQTNSDGQVMVTYQKGYPYYAVIAKNEQKTYIKVNPGNELSTSTFDVAGEQIKDGIRGYIWTERGVWRPGDDIYVNFVMDGKKLPENHPVTIEFRSPLGQLYQKNVATKPVGGIYSFKLATDQNSQTGVWGAKITVGGASFNKRIRIEAVKPNRLKIDLKFKDQVIQRGQALNANLHGEWLTGAKIGGLKYVIETEFRSVNNSFAGYDGYQFNNEYRSFKHESGPKITGQTDAQGNALITNSLWYGKNAGGMLKANITTRLFEPSGEASVNGTEIMYSPYNSYVGIKSPDGADDRLDTDKDYKFEIATVSLLGKPMPNHKVKINVYKLHWYWWWRSDQSTFASYVSDSNLEPVKSMTVTTSVMGRSSFNINMPSDDWGTYYVTARDVESDHESASVVYIDWPNYGSRQSEADGGSMKLSVSLDKKEYNVGDKATISFPASANSRAIISVENGSKVLKTFPVECLQGQMKFTFDVTADMQPNVFLNVTLLQPYASVKNDLPIRLYGIVPLIATTKESKLQPIITCVDEVLPESKMTITISEENKRPFAYSLAIVDEGLLDLTNFRTPNPWSAFNAKVALGVSTWDVYNNVLGAYGGKIEQMFAIGGDAALDPTSKPSVNRFPPMVKYIGTFELKKGQKKKHEVKLPAYMGKVRVMAVAVTNSDDDKQNAWGAAEKSVAVRAPLMILGSAPRAVANGDELEVTATILATQDGIGNVTTTIKADPKMFTVIGNKQQVVAINKIGDQIVSFNVRVNDNMPVGEKGGAIELIATSSSGVKSKYQMNIPIRKLTLPVSKGNSFTLAKGKSWSGNVELIGMIGTQTLMMEVSSMQPINAVQRMEYLNAYPYGCVEQITSAIFPLLYLGDMMSLSEDERKTAKDKILLVMSKYKNYSIPDGSLGLWTGSTRTNMWGSAYAFHFMTVAKKKGYDIPSGLYERLQKALTTFVVRWNKSDRYSNAMVNAYQLYVLALSGAPELGAMNRMRQSDNLSLESTSMLAAAYAETGRQDVGKAMIAQIKTVDDNSNEQQYLTYGSSQRTQSVQLLAASSLGMFDNANELVEMISKELTSNSWMSTQTSAWCMMSIGDYVGKKGKAASILDFEWEAAGDDDDVVSNNKTPMWSKQWLNPNSNKMAIENNSDGTIYIRTVSSGISSGRGITENASKISVSVTYLDANEKPIDDISSLPQGTDFISKVTVRNLSAKPIYDLMLTEPVASGWEIRPDEKASSKYVDYRDIRDDRANSYIPLLRSNSEVVVITKLNATYKGIYTLPAVQCDAMYDGEVTANTASKTTTVK